MHRFYSGNGDFRGDTITIKDPAEIHHLGHVLRLKKGDPVELFNEKGEEASGRITGLSGDRVLIRIDSRKRGHRGHAGTVILACAVPKKSKFESIIEKCTELGIDQVLPMVTDRTEVKFPPEKVLQKQERYHTVAVNAAKQSQRSNVPTVFPPTRFQDILGQIDEGDLALICATGGSRKKIPDALHLRKDPKRIFILIGPEGDFTPDELREAKKAGCVAVALGEHVLKVDTAAIVAVSLILLLKSK